MRMRVRFVRSVLAAGMVLASGVVVFGASHRKPVKPAEKETAAEPQDFLKSFKFRNLGPAVGGGRVTSVVGIPGDANLYYIGAAAGGVFKTTDGGESWKPIFEKEPVSSIGAIALDPSNPSKVWVGTGEANIRNDVIAGRGVYLSADAGNSWRFMGLGDVGQISKIIVDPHDGNRVWVAAVGHTWGPNAERGVYRSTDGGATWKKVLFVDDTTGAGDLEMQPGNPEVLLAGMWQIRRYPWELIDGGEGSGIYRSTDGGSTWKKLTKDLPEGPLGRIALAFAPSNPEHVYALIEAKKGMLWESENLGDDWKKVSDNHMLDVRPFYFSKMFVSPRDEQKIYFLSFTIVESDDGGKTAHIIGRHVHPDHHALWIDPTNPDRMIEGNDGGVYTTSDAGKTWVFRDTIPIEQFYMVSAGSSAPYDVCGGLQDNNAWCGPSNSVSRVGITGADWFVVTGGDGEYAVIAPSDPHIIYVDSQNGNISRLDTRTHVSRFIKPYLRGVEDMTPAELKYRFNWTSPIAVSRTDADTVYLGGNVLFKSTDGGGHWSVISPDLTRNDKGKQVASGGPIQLDLSGAETYGTIMSITLAETDPNVIWVGSDDGLVHVTRDGGKTWNDVTSHMPKHPEWGRVYQIGVSPFDAGAAYVAVDRHMLDDLHPYVYKTKDYGKTWTAIDRGLPDNAPVSVVREDPNLRGFLVAGTDLGLFFSHDDGGTWQPLKAGFPTAPVWDVQFVKPSHDLVIATHGRGLFVLDNITPLEQLAPAVASADFHLFSSLPGTIFHQWNRAGFGAAGASTPNPPNGVMIDYYLNQEIKPKKEAEEKEGERAPHEGPVTISVTDSAGHKVFTGHGKAEKGVNRFVWNMHYDGPKRLTFEKQAPGESEFFNRRQGPWVVPGQYKVTVSVAGHHDSETVTVVPDPRLPANMEAFREQTATALRLRAEVNALNESLNRLDSFQKQLASVERLMRGQSEPGEGKMPAPPPIVEAARALGKKIKTLKDSVYNPHVQRDVGEDSIHYYNDFQGQLQSLGFGLSFAYDQAPSQVVLDEMGVMRKKLDDYLTRFNDLLSTDIAAFNKEAAAANAPVLVAGEAVNVAEVPAP
jgi:photosystem II stability/assembly factor-like uncharacterized protein